MNRHMVSTFLAMEFILLLHLNCNMMKMALLKWCGMCLQLYSSWEICEVSCNYYLLLFFATFVL
jgi:hypothetical protein